MSGIAERVRLLRRQAGMDDGANSLATTPAAPTSNSQAPAAQGMSSRTETPLGLRLRQLLSTRSWERRPAATDVPRGRGQSALLQELPGVEVVAGLRLIVERWNPPCAGVTSLPAYSDTRGRLLFFDTETTGLAGGTGTVAFMIGAARWDGSGLQLQQWLLTRIGAEAAMLCAFAQYLRDDDELVSYNGKCFDRPLLSTRLRLQRQADPLIQRTHHDLLHAVRRRYRGHWENCRLLTAERELLGVVRRDDLPGAQAPAAWRTFLRYGCARDLRRVVEHNRQDLISLAGIYGSLFGT